VAIQGQEVRKTPSLSDIEVIALVGPSGTGKSHRAMAVAQQWGCSAVIDDGLLIAGSRILAGTSAKREETTTAAIRRAIFSSPDHVLDVKGALEKYMPSRLLVLGTSVTMVDRIVSRLGLNAPLEYLHIRDLATQDEIHRALWQRRREGKHVIPAPTFEVKKTFSGYLVDPLRMFTRSRTERQALGDRSVVRPTYSYLGHFYIADAVVMQMAQKVCLEVDGVKRVLKAIVISTGRGAIIHVELVLLYRKNYLEIMKQVQQALKEKLEYLTGIYLERVDVSTKKISLE
jgi:uncharacterized alkaline shock family protein YloU